MAVIWQKQADGNRYEVRSAGATRRLYTNGVFHSQFNPRQRLTGGVWDLLLLAAFFRPIEELRRVLVLGVGGGAVIRQLLHFAPGQLDIIGVDMNPVHLEVARRFFALPETVGLHHADARAWLEAHPGEKFDLVIDDLFGHEAGVAERAIEADARWCRLLQQHLPPRGILAMNFGSPAELRASALPSLVGKRRTRHLHCLLTPMDENAVAIFSSGADPVPELRRRLRQFPELDTRRSSTRLRFSVRRVR